MINFFIDADNLSKPEWIDQAFAILKETKLPISLRRAYGDMGKLEILMPMISKHNIDPFPNLRLSKNTTDVALVVGVMAVAYSKQKPEIVVIGSGDADFAPLAMHLRELDIKVICVTTMKAATLRVGDIYDKVIFIDDKTAERAKLPDVIEYIRNTKKRVETEPKPEPKPETKQIQEQASEQELDDQILKELIRTMDSKSVKRDVLSLAKSKVKTEVRPVFKNLSDRSLKCVLKAAPELADGGWKKITKIGVKLRRTEVMNSKTKPLTFFKSCPGNFELRPLVCPEDVRMIWPD